MGLLNPGQMGQGAMVPLQVSNVYVLDSCFPKVLSLPLHTLLPYLLSRFNLSSLPPYPPPSIILLYLLISPDLLPLFFTSSYLPSSTFYLSIFLLPPSLESLHPSTTLSSLLLPPSLLYILLLASLLYFSAHNILQQHPPKPSLSLSLSPLTDSTRNSFGSNSDLHGLNTS